jgi:hypothetical protein
MRTWCMPELDQIFQSIDLQASHFSTVRVCADWIICWDNKQHRYRKFARVAVMKQRVAVRHPEHLGEGKPVKQ